MWQATEEDWIKCKQTFDNVFEQYKDLLGQPGVNVLPAIKVVFNPLLTRYNQGERSQALYEAMTSVK